MLKVGGGGGGGVDAVSLPPPHPDSTNTNAARAQDFHQMIDFDIARSLDRNTIRSTVPRF